MKISVLQDKRAAASNFQTTHSSDKRMGQKKVEEKLGAGGGSRTHTALRPLDFESSASAISPLRRVLDSTRLAPVAKALLDARSLFTIRSVRKSYTMRPPAL